MTSTKQSPGLDDSFKNLKGVQRKRFCSVRQQTKNDEVLQSLLSNFQSLSQSKTKWNTRIKDVELRLISHEKEIAKNECQVISSSNILHSLKEELSEVIRETEDLQRNSHDSQNIFDAADVCERVFYSKTDPMGKLITIRKRSFDQFSRTSTKAFAASDFDEPPGSRQLHHKKSGAAAATSSTSASLLLLNFPKNHNHSSLRSNNNNSSNNFIQKNESQHLPSINNTRQNNLTKCASTMMVSGLSATSMDEEIVLKLLSLRKRYLQADAALIEATKLLNDHKKRLEYASRMKELVLYSVDEFNRKEKSLSQQIKKQEFLCDEEKQKDGGGGGGGAGSLHLPDIGTHRRNLKN